MHITTDARGRNSRGMLGGELARGTDIEGWGTVAGMTVGNGMDGPTVIVTRMVPGRRGRRARLGDERTYYRDRRVPGTRYRTDMPAGPVGRKPGVAKNGAFGETGAARHDSLIANLTYA